MGILRRAQSLSSTIHSRNGRDSRVQDRKASASELSFKKSPITRLLTWHVGRGASSGLFQQVAHAAVEEAGSANLTPRSLSFTSG